MVSVNVDYYINNIFDGLDSLNYCIVHINSMEWITELVTLCGHKINKENKFPQLSIIAYSASTVYIFLL